MNGQRARSSLETLIPSWFTSSDVPEAVDFFEVSDDLFAVCHTFFGMAETVLAPCFCSFILLDRLPEVAELAQLRFNIADQARDVFSCIGDTLYVSVKCCDKTEIDLYYTDYGARFANSGHGV